MKKFLRASILAFLALAASSAFAAKPVTAAGDGKVVESCPTGIKVATGAPKKGYANTYANIKEVCGAKVNICQVQTSGGLENLPLLSRKGADIGIAAFDTLKDMAPGDENIASLQVVLPLNYNYLHIVVAAKGFSVAGPKKWGGMVEGDRQTVVISKFSDLKNQKVALVGSAKLLGHVLNRMFKDRGYNMQFVEVAKDDDAFAMVKAAQVAAVFSIAGVPHGPVDALTSASGLTLASFDEEVSMPYVVRKFNYDKVGSYNTKALAVQNVLLTRPFGPEKMAQVAALRSCIVENLQRFKDGEYEPAWNEMRFDTQLDWMKMPAQAAAPAAAATPSKKK